MRQNPETIRLLRRIAFPAPTDAESMLNCAHEFGYTLGGWRKKEFQKGSNMRALTRGEFLYLALLARQHPQYKLSIRETKVHHLTNDFLSA